jgi:hypothetical protein
MDPDHIKVRRHGSRELIWYEVRPEQLSMLEKTGGDVGFDFQIAQFFLTLSLSFLASLILSPPPPGLRQSVFVSIVVVGTVLWPIFSIRWYRGRGAFSKIVREIRDLPEVGPMGDEGHQIKPGDLVSMQPQSDPSPPVPRASNPEPEPAQAVVESEKLGQKE